MTQPKMLPSTRLAIQVAMSAVIAVLLVDAISLERPYWVVLTATLVMVGTVGETLAKSIDRTLGTLLGLLAGAVIYWTATLIKIPHLALLIVSVPCVIFFKFISYRMMIVGLTVALVFLFRLGGADNALLFARLADTAIGAAIAAFVSIAVLPIRTRQPAIEIVDAYIARLAAAIHDSIAAVVEGGWQDSIEATADSARNAEADLHALIDALKVESALIASSGQVARNALLVLPILRGHVESLVQACQSAATGAPGREIAGELSAIDRQLSDNLRLVRNRLVSGTEQEIPRLEDYFRKIDATLAPQLSESSQTRHDIMRVLNVLLALRRLNRGLRHAMESIR
jgi:Fusaric acid resistance protein-like